MESEKGIVKCKMTIRVRTWDKFQEKDVRILHFDFFCADWALALLKVLAF